MEDNLQNEIKNFNKQYKISSELSKKFSFIPKNDKVQSSSIAGRPKKMLAEITKRFFSNPIVVISLLVFTFILLSSLIIPARSITDYQANKPINKYSFIESLPPIYNPIVTKWTTKSEEFYKFYKNLTTSIEKLPEEQKNLWNSWFKFYLESVKFQTNDSGQEFITYNAYHLFRASLLNELLHTSLKNNAVLTDEYVQNTIFPQIPVLKTYLGTSSTGYDIWVTTWYATWRGIQIAIIVTVIQAIFGITIGAVLGFYAGKLVDTIVMRLIDIFNSPPTIIWILIFVGIFGTNQTSLILAMSIAGWPSFIGLTRLYVITVKNEEYISAAKAIGASTSRQIFVHALPAIIGKIANSFVKNVPAIILWVASLAFLGFFKNGNDTNLGQILIESASEAGQNIWIILLPTLILLFLSLSLNFMALGIHDALDPRVMSKGKRK
ncbi:ABC transporter permease [Metamycoplasma canadense]|uniref:Oligopeptide ABC transporter n=1 Tax=Metamycoplasma canadense TaxID=29554 RepID=A0A077L960_9BACT|nr:ABC transporter permease [Metamycoplasma canadense]BAP39553.1 oligopeptide ABC transporter [Metamycoplasma canadense]